ncbi:GNAT family N-acetyltransferase [Sanguibacter antarcticus]|uniref:GNAT family N-acetyltransferase n=1 Tax=Sanguibacter antarcticus TaxID=372484 RepID=UPI001472A7C4|nr:GNAT family N-acetyltransferase [Sanguibacter antarcticus]
MLPVLTTVPQSATEPVTDRLVLSRPQAHDIDAIWQIHSDPETNKHNPTVPIRTRHQAADRLSWFTAHWDEFGFGYWSVRLRDPQRPENNGPGEPIGFAGLRWSRWAGRNVVNLYYRLTPAVWGCGLASEAARASVALWHEYLSDHPLVARTTPDNVGSQRTALAAGFERRPDLDRTTALGRDIVLALGWKPTP